MMHAVTYHDAKVAGLSRFYPGVLCKYGHDSQRFVSSKNCCICSRMRLGEWRLKNREKCNAARRAWVLANPEKNRESKARSAKRDVTNQAKRSRSWYLQNKQKADEASKAWIEANPGKVNAHAARYRADILKRTPAWADLNQIDLIYQQARSMREAGEEVDVDHDIPLRGKRVSGLHVHYNLRIIPSRLNKSKSNHYPF